MNVIQTTVCLIGSYGVGKSSLVTSYIYNKFNNNIESTIGMSFFTKLIKHNNYCIDFGIIVFFLFVCLFLQLVLLVCILKHIYSL